jgi:ketosteroid isomerase-like protein
MDIVTTELQKIIQQYHRVLQRTDLSAVLSTYTEDARLVRPDGTVVEEPTQMVVLWKPYIEKGSKKTVCETVALQLNGTIAYEIASFHFGMSRAPVEEGHYLAVWRKEGERWQIQAQVFASGGSFSLPARRDA